MWLDNWDPAGVLIEKYGFRIIYTFSTVLNNRVWCWRPTRSDDLVDIQGKLPEVRIGDFVMSIWSVSKKKNYVSSDTWEFLRS